MDVCVENVFITPGIEAINVTQATAEEKDRAASSGPHHEHQETGAEQEAVAQGFSPADSSETPQAETAAEKNPWSAWAWLGLCKTSSHKIPNTIPNIVHVDIDAFFASVEQVLNPKLRGKPVLVGRGCVASASYEAKFLGVKTAMGFREALRVCPQAIVVPGQYEHYADFAERVRRILETYTPAVETAALDDFYLDFSATQPLYPAYETTLRPFQAEIRSPRNHHRRGHHRHGISRRLDRVSQRAHRLNPARIRQAGAHHRPAHPLRRSFFRAPDGAPQQTNQRRARTARRRKRPVRQIVHAPRGRPPRRRQRNQS